MRLRSVTFVVVFVLVLMAFSGVLHANPDETPESARESVYVQDIPPGQLSPTAVPGDPVLTRKTHSFSFDAAAEGFMKEVDRPYSEVAWDGVAKHVSVLSDRRDPADEMLTRPIDTLDLRTDFTVTARWATTQQGNWRGAFPIFLAASSNAQPDAANSIYVFYYSRDWYLGQNPSYFLRYQDSLGVFRLNVEFVAAPNTEYAFYIDYIASVRYLRMEVRTPEGATLAEAEYILGSNPDDGFTLGKVGVSSLGTGASWEPVTIGWVDDIRLSYVSTISSTLNVVKDLGDQAYRLGWFADNFNDNVKDPAWLTDQGSWTLSGGFASLATNSQIRVATGQWDTKLQARVTVTGTGTGTQYAKMLFRWTDAGNHHWLEIWEKTDTVSLKRIVSGVTTTIWSGTKVLSLNQPNVVKIDAMGGSFVLEWNDVVLWQGMDASSPAASGPAAFGFATVGTKAKIAVDDVRGWTADTGSVVTKDYSHATQIRTVHTGSAFNWVDILVQSSTDNVTFGEWHYVKAGAESRTADADAYYVQDADEAAYMRFRVDLRATNDFSPSLSDVVVQERTLRPMPDTTLGHEAWQYYVGGIVNAYGGNLFLKRTDLALPAKGWSLSFERSYNSLSSHSGPLGPAWTHAFNAFLTAGAGVVTFTDGDGTIHTFDDLGGGAYGAPRGLGGMKLIRNADATYTLFKKDGSKWSFSSAGKLAQMTDRNGNKLTMTYDGNGRLTKIADDSGISQSLAYDASGRISKVADQNGTQALTSPMYHSGAWASGQNAFSSNNLYASSKVESATHRFWGYGFGLPLYTWITKVEVCVEGYTDGDDDVAVRISTDGGYTWSPEKILDLPRTDPNGLSCLDFSDNHVWWEPGYLSDAMFRVEVRYVQVGRKAGTNFIDWIPVRVGTAGRSYEYAYDGSGRLSSVTDPLGKSELYVYSAFLEKFVDRADKVLRFVPDESSRIMDVFAGQYNRSTSGIDWEYRLYHMFYVYGKAKYVRVTDAMGNWTFVYMDELGARPNFIEGPLASSGGCSGCSCAGCSSCGSGGGELILMDWDGENNCVEKADGLGQATKTSYDWRGNVVRVTDATGNYTENTWLNRDDGTVFDSLLVAHRGRRGFVTTQSHDSEGNPLKTTDPLGFFTEQTYDDAGFLKTVKDKRGYTTTHDYDGHGWRTKTTDPLGHAVQTEYDAVGRPIRTVTPLTASTRATYNDNDWMVSQTNDLGFTTTFEYNGRGDRTAVVDANGNRTTYLVNVTCASVWKTIEADGSVTLQRCDLLGRLVEVVDPNGKTWTSEYDMFSRKIREVDPFGQAVQFAYDPAGNLVTRIDGNGMHTNSTYDVLDRLVRVDYQDGSVLATAFDAAGNKIVETGYGFTRTSSYDALGRVTRVEFDFGAFSKVMQYTYDANGNRGTMVYPDGFTVTYGWNEDGLLTSMQAAGQTWAFAYDQDHRRTSAAHPNGLELNYSFDSANRLTAVRSKDTASGLLLEGTSYTLDNVANQRTREQEANSTTLSFDYTSDYNLETTTYEDGQTSSYVYDANDNRLYLNKTGDWYETYEYDEDSSLYLHAVYWGGSLKLRDIYAYDGNGNRIRDSVWTPKGSATYYFDYDLENRLVQKRSGTWELASYAYFADGARIRRSDYGTPTYFLYDFEDFSGFEDIIEEYDATGAVVARYLHGPGVDEPLAKQYQGAWYYYHFDGLGSVTMLTRADKTVANRYVYDDFGLFRDREEAVPNFYGFAGREYDEAADLYYFRARYYDAWIGSFLTRDPSGMSDGPNTYVYTGANPVSNVDPSGRCTYNWLCYLSPLLTFIHVGYDVRRCSTAGHLTQAEKDRLLSCVTGPIPFVVASCLLGLILSGATIGLSAIVGCGIGAISYLVNACRCLNATCKYDC